MKLLSLSNIRLIFGIAFSTALAIIFYIFYSSSLKNHVEDYFFDLRTRIKPRTGTIQDITIIEINDSSLQMLPKPEKGMISYDLLLNTLDKIQRSSAKEIVILLYQNIFDFNDKKINHLIEEVNKDSRITLGTLGVMSSLPSNIEFPHMLESIRTRVFGVDTLKNRSTSIVRDMRVTGFEGQTPKILLPAYLASKTRKNNASTRSLLIDSMQTKNIDAHYFLNFVDSSHFKRVEVPQFLRDDFSLEQELKDQIVIVGFTSFKEWPTQTREQITANTPLKGQVDSYKHGESITYITANAIENLIHDRWLWQPSLAYEIAQTTIVTASFVFIWILGTVPATVLIFFGWLLILSLHAILFEFFALNIPLASTALFSSVAIIIGALWRLDQVLQIQVVIKNKAKTDLEIMQLQSRFLDRFSLELSKINNLLIKKMKSLFSAMSENAPPAADRQLLQRALASGEDFGEYLEGINQLSSIQGPLNTKSHIHIESVSILKIVKAVLERFDAKIEESQINVTLSCDSTLKIRTNSKIVDTIIFNFVSNAIKYSGKKSTIFIRAFPLNNEHIIIEIEDNGPGIPLEYQEKIFEKFYRIKNDNVYRVKGTGLGLYLCRYFSESIGATVSCRSVVGQGSTFCLKLKKR